MQNIKTIHWSIVCDTHTAPRTGTTLPHKGESWPHMARFLVQSAGNDWYLVAYSVDENGDEVERYEIDEDTEITVQNDPALWFRDPYAQKKHPTNEHILIGGGKFPYMRDVSSQIYVQKYTHLGSYPLFYIDRDNCAVCPACVGTDILNATDPDPHNRETITAHAINYEDPHLYCDQCGERIESAYAEPETMNA